MRLSWQEVMLALAMAFVVVGPFSSSSSMIAEAQQISASCTAPLLNLQPCLVYISSGNTSVPGPECCTPLNTILSSNDSSTCLCDLANTTATFNATRAKEIAADCKVAIPSAVESCLNGTSGSNSTTPPPPPPSSTTTSPGSSTSSPLLLNTDGWSLSITIFYLLGIYVCSSWFIS